MENQFDLIVIGSGPGGYVAAIRASQLGMKVGVIERESLGGICLNWGCIPTKALLKTAEVYEYFNHSKDYGINNQGHSADFPAVVKRSRDVANGMSKGIQFLFRKNKIEAIIGVAKMNKDKSIEVTAPDGTKKSYRAKNVILAVGARSRQLKGMEIDGKKIIGYREAMTLPFFPKTMLVMGSGAIGTEFAYFYHALGTKVTLVEYLDNICPLEDEDVSKALLKIYKNKGMEILTNSKVTTVTKTDSGVKVAVETPKGIVNIEAEVMLSAVGIVANIENIGIEEMGLKMENGKIWVDDFYKTNLENIYAIGDCVHGPSLAHKASAEGILCVEKLAGHHPEPLDYNNVPSCVYCQPEIASLGYTEKKAKELGYELKIGKFPFTASGKASAAGKKDGFVKVIFDAKYGELLGAHLIGSNVTEMIAEFVVARKLETTGYELIKSIHPHPTMSEAMMEAVADAFGEVIHL